MDSFTIWQTIQPRFKLIDCLIVIQRLEGQKL